MQTNTQRIVPQTASEIHESGALRFVCPDCRSELGLSGDTLYVCDECQSRFPIREGIPFLYSKDIRDFIEAGQSLSREDVEAMAKDQEQLSINVAIANIDFHNQTASSYEQDFSTKGIRSGPSEQRLQSALKEFSERYSSGKYLDIGCGTGRMLQFGKQLFATAIGLDITPAMLEQAANRNLAVVLGNAYRLPFADETFDVITIFSTLHHMPDPENIVVEALRALKHGGLLYVDLEPNSNAYQLVKNSFYRSLPIVRKCIDRDARVGDEKAVPSYLLAEYFHTMQSGINPQKLSQLVQEKASCKVRYFFVDENRLTARHKSSWTMKLFYLGHFLPWRIYQARYARYVAFIFEKP